MLVKCCKSPEQRKNVRLFFIHLGGQLDIWVELFSQHYLQESLFTTNVVHLDISHEEILALFIVCTGVNFFLFSEFLPMKVK